MTARRETARARRGALLLETLVALTVLATAGAAIVAYVAGVTTSVATARDRARELQRASALMDAVVLWPREDLDRHLGTRAEGAFTLSIARVAPDLYVASLGDSAASRPLLRTAIFRERER